MTERRRWSAAARREVLDLLAVSGRSRWAFAQDVGVPNTTLMSWTRRDETDPADGSSLPFLPVAVLPSADSGRAAHLEVSLGDVTVRVETGFDEALLVRVMRTLRTC